MARRRTKLGIAVMFCKGLGSLKKNLETILCVRTKNRERCPWQKKPRRLRDNTVKGIRQSSPVSSVEGVPGQKCLGCNSKRGPTV